MQGLDPKGNFENTYAWGLGALTNSQVEAYGSYKTKCNLHKGVTKPPKGLNQQVAPTQTPRRPTKS